MGNPLVEWDLSDMALSVLKSQLLGSGINPTI